MGKFIKLYKEYHKPLWQWKVYKPMKKSREQMEEKKMNKNEIKKDPAWDFDLKLSPKEDLREWLVDNWDEIENSIQNFTTEYLNNNDFDRDNEVDRDELSIYISEELKKGIFNVIDTYKE